MDPNATGWLVTDQDGNVTDSGPVAVAEMATITGEA